MAFTEEEPSLDDIAANDPEGFQAALACRRLLEHLEEDPDEQVAVVSMLCRVFGRERVVQLREKLANLF